VRPFRLTTTTAAWLLCLIVAGAASLPALAHLGASLGDTDDAMRLVEARALLHGRGWWDLIEPRLAPPGGLAVHWSRLVDAPIAALLALSSAILGSAGGELFTRAAWPLLLFAPTGWMLIKSAEKLGGGAIAPWIAAVLAPLSWMIWDQFAPGRLDHHNVQLLLMAGAMWAALSVARWESAAILGAACGVSLAIGFETLPVIAWAAGLVGVRFVLSPHAARATLAFGAALAGAAALAFLIQTPPSWWTRSGCDALQFNGVAAALVAGGALAAAAWLSPAARALRFIGMAAAGALSAAAFIGLHPTCLHGPYADIDPRIHSIWLDRVGEARPLAAVLAAQPLMALSMALLPLGALAASGLAIARGRREPGFLALAGLLALTAIVGLAQTRGLVLATAAAIPLAAALLARLPNLGAVRPALAGLALGFAASPTVMLLALDAVAPASVQAKEQSAVRDQTPCFTASAFSAMGRLPPGVVLADLDAGPHIIANTAHAAAAGPYHRLGPAIFDAMTVFYETPQQAATIVARDGADYVALCRVGVFASEAKPGGFAYALLNGAPPAWLRPLESRDGEYLLFGVDRARLPRP
jgi:hypothetical protein